MTNQPQFDVFLAYNSQDNNQVRIIARKLEQRGLNVWIDEDQIPPGRPFQDVIQQAIQNVKSAAIFIGLGGLGRWQVLEQRSLLGQLVDANIPVIPVLLPGVDKIPKDLSFLQNLNWVQFANGIDDEKALNKLIWGITQQRPVVLPQASGNFDVLLFYNDEDNQEVQLIINNLRERQIQLWLTQNVRGGDSWQQILETQLANISSVAIVIGRNSSLWRREEIEPFIWEFIEQGRPVIPIILPNVLQEPELPIYLQRRTRVDFRQIDPDPMEQLIRGIREISPETRPQKTHNRLATTLRRLKQWADELNQWFARSRRQAVVRVGLLACLVAVVLYTISRISLEEACDSKLGDHLSCGEESLYKSTEKKQRGNQTFVNGDYDKAVTLLDQVWQNEHDPEALIYRNNAQARINTQQTQKNLYTIAVAVSLNSPDNDPNAGLEVLRGIAQAQKEAVDKNINLQVLIADDANDLINGQSIKVAQALVKRDIQAVIGHNTSDVTSMVLPIYEKKQLVLISATSTASNLSSRDKDTNHIFFRTVSTTATFAQGLVEYLDSKAHHQKVAIFSTNNQNSTYSQDQRRDFESALNNSPFDDSVDLRFDLSSAYIGNEGVIKSQQTSALAFFPDGHTSVNAFSNALQLVKATLKENPNLWVVGGNVFSDTETLKVLSQLSQKDVKQDVLNHFIIILPWHFLNSINPKFLDNANNLWNTKEVSWRTATSYDAVQVLLEVLHKKDHFTRQELQQILVDPTFEAKSDATGPIHFLYFGKDKTDPTRGGDRKEKLSVLVKLIPNCPNSKEPYTFVPEDYTPDKFTKEVCSS